MPEKKIEGVNVDVTGHKSMERKYSQSDVEVLFRRGHWKSWDETIQWLETQGERDNELTPGETIAMTEDLRQVRNSGEQFTNDPTRVHQLMRQHHGVREGGQAPAPQPTSEEIERQRDEERRRAAEQHRLEMERQQMAESREEAEHPPAAEVREEARHGEEELYSEKGILRKGGYIWRD